MELDPELQKLVYDIGDAANNAIRQSEKIARVVEAIKGAGYDVTLGVEITIGLNTKTPEPNAPTGELKLTEPDLKFLQALKISLENEDGS